MAMGEEAGLAKSGVFRHRVLAKVRVVLREALFCVDDAHDYSEAAEELRERIRDAESALERWEEGGGQTEASGP